MLGINPTGACVRKHWPVVKCWRKRGEGIQNAVRLGFGSWFAKASIPVVDDEGTSSQATWHRNDARVSRTSCCVPACAAFCSQVCMFVCAISDAPNHCNRELCGWACRGALCAGGGRGALRTHVKWQL